MDTNLIAVRTFDFAIAYDIANHPDIHGAFTEDDTGPYMPDVVNESWIVLYTETGEIAGAYNLTPILRRTLEIHAFVLPEYRDKYAKLSGWTVLEWCINNAEFDKITTVIPKTSKHIYHFVKMFGFKEEGFERESFLKHGKLHGMYRMGITKPEILASLRAKDE